MPESNPELIEVRISNLEQTFASKITMLEQKVDSATKATEQGFEYLGKLLDQRFAQADQKAEHTSRETRQSIEFLTEQLKATMLDQSATATKVSFIETDVTRHAASIKYIQEELEHKALAKDVADLEKDVDKRAAAKELEELRENIQWHYRAFAGALIASIVGGAIAISQFVN
ncbi:UNVERIFIED_CONTAM: hypothetical protein RF653_09980 [Kocuria sp. CPCC 205316]|uniref:hypothetical protein n=1 Tax=Kocuria TaxID=57493 RepID=UPI0036DA97E5